jgi:hypothetical protein
MNPIIIPDITPRNIIIMITVLFSHITSILPRDAGRNDSITLTVNVMRISVVNAGENFREDSHRDIKKSDTKKARPQDIVLKRI